jgi:4-amino-4-deoxy-L-arabinose transferase-like glycosyltransferase
VNAGRLSPERLLVLGVLLLIALVFLHVDAKNPPGFYRDESAIAYNAYTLSTGLKDEYGARLPLFIRSFGDYKSPLYVYLLAAVFRVTGPSTAAARTLSAVLGLAAVLVVYRLALAIARRRVIALAVTALAGLSPWLFEISRLVFEVALEPLLIALFLLTLYRAQAGEWRRRQSLALGLLLGATVYAYQAGRIFAPCFALGLVLCWGRSRPRAVAATCGVFLATLVPVVVYGLVHRGALEARYRAVTWIGGGVAWWQVPWRFLGHYASNVNLWNWLVHGDSVERHHVPGDGSLFWVEVGLALAGTVIVLLRRRHDPWWRFVLFGLICSPIAASLTIGSIMTLRMITVPLLLPLLAIPALEAVAALRSPALRAGVVGLLVVAFAFEVVHWQVAFARNGPKRLGPFEAQIRPVIEAALRRPGTLYAYRAFHASYIDSLFFGASAGRSRSSIVILDGGAQPPPGSLVVGSVGECAGCHVVAADGPYEAYVTPR